MGRSSGLAEESQIGLPIIDSLAHTWPEKGCTQMIEWTPESIDRLFELYQRHFDRLQKDVGAVNLSLGAPGSKKGRLERLTRAQFEALLKDETKDQEAIELWVRRISRDHENDFRFRHAAG